MHHHEVKNFFLTLRICVARSIQSVMIGLYVGVSALPTRFEHYRIIISVSQTQNGRLELPPSKLCLDKISFFFLVFCLHPKKQILIKRKNCYK